jgi:adenosylhomocysteine nucleosidase
MRMRVLVTFAVDAEFAPWRKLRAFHSIDYDGLRLWSTKAGNSDVTVLITGVGTESSAKAMGLMMQMADDNQKFDICISSGLAGALHDTLVPGDIIAPKSLLAENVHADLQSDRLTVDPDLWRQALEAGAIVADCLLTTGQVLVKAKEKKICSLRAQSVDMESFDIVKEAYAWGARSIVLRAISDSADEDLPINFNLTLSKQHHISITKVMQELIKNPLAFPALLRFGRQSRYAAERLAKFLDSYVQKIGSSHLSECKSPQAVAR